MTYDNSRGSGPADWSARIQAVELPGQGTDNLSWSSTKNIWDINNHRTMKPGWHNIIGGTHGPIGSKDEQRPMQRSQAIDATQRALKNSQHTVAYPRQQRFESFTGSSRQSAEQGPESPSSSSYGNQSTAPRNSHASFQGRTAPYDFQNSKYSLNSYSFDNAFDHGSGNLTPPPNRPYIQPQIKRDQVQPEWNTNINEPLMQGYFDKIPNKFTKGDIWASAKSSPSEIEGIHYMQGVGQGDYHSDMPAFALPYSDANRSHELWTSQNSFPSCGPKSNGHSLSANGHGLSAYMETLSLDRGPNTSRQSQLYLGQQTNGPWRAAQRSSNGDYQQFERLRANGHAGSDPISDSNRSIESHQIEPNFQSKPHQADLRQRFLPTLSRGRNENVSRGLPNYSVDEASFQGTSQGEERSFHSLAFNNTNAQHSPQHDGMGSVHDYSTRKDREDSRHRRGAPMSRSSTITSSTQQHPIGPSNPLVQNGFEPPLCLPSARSEILEEFKNNSKCGKSFELRDIYNHIVEFSGDQNGSRFIQNKLDLANSEEKARIFNEILPNALPLMMDVFGNYIIQKFFELGEQNQKRLLASKMKGQMMTLSLHVYGCRVVQKALQFILVEEQVTLVKELENNVTKCVKDQNGNHVVQAAIEHVPPEHMPFMINNFIGQVRQFSMHAYGCRVVQRLLKYWMEPGRSKILEEVQACAGTLISDQYGNYVVQYVLEYERETDRQKIIEIVRRDLVNCSKQKFASNVVEKCIIFGDDTLRQEIMTRLSVRDERGQSPLAMLIRDPYGNYVIQKLLEMLDETSRGTLVERLTAGITSARRMGPNKQVENVAKKMHSCIAASVSTQLPTPPSTNDGSRSSSTGEERYSNSTTSTIQAGAFRSSGPERPTTMFHHHFPFELPTSRS